MQNDSLERVVSFMMFANHGHTIMNGVGKILVSKIKCIGLVTF